MGFVKRIFLSQTSRQRSRASSIYPGLDNAPPLRPNGEVGYTENWLDLADFGSLFPWLWVRLLFGCLSVGLRNFGPSVGLRNSRTHLPNEDNSPRRYGWDNHHYESLQLREPAPRLHFLTFPGRDMG